MLVGLEEILSQNNSLDAQKIQTHILENKEAIYELKGVSGQFKTLYQISDTLALACIKHAGAKKMFENERKLLQLLGEIGLPVIDYYGEIFEMEPLQQAVIMDWIPQAMLFDSKDIDSANAKLVALVTGVSVPSGEGWVLQKNKIESDVKAQLAKGEGSFLEVKLKANTIAKSLKTILQTINQHNYAICDLQVLISDTKAWIIDPLDVLKVITLGPNQVTYQSMLDSSKQDNPEFVMQVNSGKKLLMNSIAWCEAVSEMQTPQDLLEFMMKGPSAKPVKSGNLLKQVMSKGVGPRQPVPSIKTNKTISPYSSTPVDASEPQLLKSVENLRKSILPSQMILPISPKPSRTPKKIVIKEKENLDGNNVLEESPPKSPILFRKESFEKRKTLKTSTSDMVQTIASLSFDEVLSQPLDNSAKKPADSSSCLKHN